MTSEKDEFYYHENLVHPAALSHPAPRRALVIGGGDGGSSEELLKHPTLESVAIVELDQAVVDIARKYLSRVHRGIFDDPRLTLKIGDGYRYLIESREKFDLIVLDLTDATGPASKLYTVAFYESCRAALDPGGALTLHVDSPVARPAVYRDIILRLRSVFAVVRPYLLHIPLYGSLWGMACASQTLDPLALSSREADRLISLRGIEDLQYYNGETHQAVFALPNFVRKLVAA